MLWHLMECKELKESIRDNKGFGFTGIKAIYMTTREFIKKFRADFEEPRFMPVANKAMSQMEKWLKYIFICESAKKFSLWKLF